MCVYIYIYIYTCIYILCIYTVVYYTNNAVYPRGVERGARHPGLAREQLREVRGVRPAGRDPVITTISTAIIIIIITIIIIYCTLCYYYYYYYYYCCYHYYYYYYVYYLSPRTRRGARGRRAAPGPRSRSRRPNK